MSDDFSDWRTPFDKPEQFTALGKPLLSAVTVTGPGTAVDLTPTQARSITMQVVLGGTVDPTAQTALQGSVDGVNFFGLGVVTGNGFVTSSGHVVQYVRASVLKLASGNVTAIAGYA